MTRTRPAAAGVAAAAVLLGPLPLTACGIKPTGVVESGAAARVVVPARPGTPMAYYVDPDGRLVPATLAGEPPATPRTALVRLLLGPGRTEQEAGFGTRLPRTEPQEAAAVGVAFTAHDRIEIRVPFGVAGLEPLARSQLVCSALSSVDARYTAVLRGPDTTLDPAHCDA
ncbi:hypothetical protein OOK31_06440 [Streptomyces sp. NBC_00249]|uniref:hypothetical protein n=1 Tax=Streptomyces sp. NBC_00249 TaxID=2975690 RepID=UPI00225A797F|nr:hypothetical protein [Streptomyces sp. NBC_00249]MCX5193532.1 hypothetical protein [Streptomyces sp. NBC_00249]